MAAVVVMDGGDGDNMKREEKDVPILFHDFLGTSHPMPSVNNSQLVSQMFGKEVNERLGSSHDDVSFAMQSPPRPTSSLILHQPVIFRPDSLISGWERSLPLNPGSVMHFPSRFGHSGSHMDRVSSYAYRDVNCSTLISQDAADEGSRTGMKGSGILNIINPSSSGAGNKNTAGMQPTTSKPKDTQMIEHGSSNVPSQYNMASYT